MTELIKIEEIDGEPRVDSRLIAQELGVEHKHTIEIIRRYKTKIEKYGEVTFKTAPSLNSATYQQMTVCYLNEHQSTFLVTLSRNSEKAVELKQRLVDSYFHYRNQVLNHFKIPQTMAEALQLAANQAKELEQKNKQIEEAKPKVEFVDSIERSKDAISVGDFAKILAKRGMDIGQNRLFDILKDKYGPCHLLINAYRPLQYAVDNGWLELDEYPYTTKKGEDKIAIKVLVTGKGQIYIEKKLREYFEEKRATEEARRRCLDKLKPATV